MFVLICYYGQRFYTGKNLALGSLSNGLENDIF